MQSRMYSVQRCPICGRCVHTMNVQTQVHIRFEVILLLSPVGMTLAPNENVMMQTLHFGAATDSMASVVISTTSLELYGLKKVPRKHLIIFTNWGCYKSTSRAVSQRPKKRVTLTSRCLRRPGSWSALAKISIVAGVIGEEYGVKLFTFFDYAIDVRNRIGVHWLNISHAWEVSQNHLHLLSRSVQSAPGHGERGKACDDGCPWLSNRWVSEKEPKIDQDLWLKCQGRPKLSDTALVGGTRITK